MGSSEWRIDGLNDWRSNAARGMLNLEKHAQTKERSHYLLWNQPTFRSRLLTTAIQGAGGAQRRNRLPEADLSEMSDEKDGQIEERRHYLLCNQWWDSVARVLGFQSLPLSR